MSDLILGKALIWSAYDPAGSLTAAIRTTLADLMRDQPVRLRLLSVESPGEVANSAPTLGFAIWKLSLLDELRPICDALVELRGRINAPICIVFLDANLSDCVPILAESGAQIVTSKLPSLQVALGHTVAKAPLANQGYHPLTSGIAERLPWPELADADDATL